MTKNPDQFAVRFLGNGQDPRTTKWYRVFQVRDPSGSEKLVPIPFALTETEMLKVLGTAGYPRPLNSREKAEFQKVLAAGSSSTTPLHVVSAPGWVDRTTFATPLRIYSPSGGNVSFYADNEVVDHRFRLAGDLKEWRTKVAEPCHGNSLAIFCLALAFVGPLMSVAQFDSAGFLMVGPTSIGKSTIQRIAGSVYGGGGPNGFVRTWNSTENALDLLAVSHNACILILDEANLASSRATRRAAAMIHASYRLTGGEEKLRKTNQGHPALWRLPFLGSSEEGIDQMAAAARIEIPTGQRVRMIEIRADAGSDMGVFENIPAQFRSPGDFAVALNQEACTYYGTAADRFLRKLVEACQRDQEGLRRRLQNRMDWFLRSIRADELPGVGHRVANYFALVYAAGRIAQEFGVLPWERRDLSRAIRKCHDRLMMPWQPAQPHTSELSIATVRDYIQRHKADFINLRKFPGEMTHSALSQASGIVNRTARGCEFLFEPEQFSNVCEPFSREVTLRHLKSAGLLNEQEGGKTTVTRDFPGPLNRHRVVSVKVDILKER